MTTRTRTPAAAPAWVRSVVAGPDRAARVVHRGADAVYLDVGGSAVGVLSVAATPVPCAVRTTLAVLPHELRSAEVAWVGDGRLSLGGLDVVVARTVDASVPSLDPAGAAPARRALEAATGTRVEAATGDAGSTGADGIDGVRAELPREALDALADGDAAAVPALLGRGGGLTPVGDDVLAGWLATVAAAGRRHTAVASAVTRTAGAGTTLLSATLLGCARRGDVVPQFRDLLLALAPATGRTDPGRTATGTAPAAVDDRELRRSVAALLAVGHTSGAGMLLGALLSLRHLARSPS